MLSKIIRNFVAKMVAGRTDDGIMITLPDPKKVDFQTAMLEDLLMRNGIDPQLIKTEDELKNIINQIEAVNKQKLQQAESGIRYTESAKVFDLEGQQIPPGSRIMGGKAIETEAEIAARLKAENEKGLESLKQKMAKEKARTQRISGNLRSDNMNRTEIGKPKLDEDEYDYYREILGEDGEYDYYPVKGDETKEFLEAMVKEQQDEINYMRRLYDKGALDPKPGERGRKKFLDRKAQKGEEMSQAEIEELKKLSEDPEDMADGGRIGFKKGMDRRTFMKMVGGLTALPILGKFFKGAEVAAPVAEKAAEVASGAPPYFFNLVDRIRALGKKFDGPKERSESYSYKDYQMDIDLDTGKIDIKKTKEAMIPGGDEAGISEEVYMTYKPGMADETTKGGKVVDEYEEFTARPDIDGKMKDVEDGVPDEVVREGSISKEELEQEIVEQIARDKKASGGIAMMLGE